MTRTPGCLVAASLSILLLAGTSVAQSTQQSEGSNAPSLSKARIVRLSLTDGEVKMARDGHLLEPALNNMPIVERARLETAMGVAEVEFEDNSTLVVAPDSVVEFPLLARSQSGDTLTTIRLSKGMVYVNVLNTPKVRVNLVSAAGSVELTPASHVRLDVKGENARLAVFKGNVRVVTSEGTMAAGRKQSVGFQAGAGPELLKGLQSHPLDAWDKRSVEYHSRLATIAALRNSQYMFGTSDMAYYGSFVNAGSCGSMWRPYLASASWDPFSVGVWAWYQGAGYSWVSPYPWGWTPYHSGTWMYCAGTGWGWQPNANWTGLDNGTKLFRVHGPGSPTKPPTPPPVHPPRPGEPTLRMVSVKPIVRSDVGSTAVVFRMDSAGLGVPREGMGNLSRISREAGSRGGEAIRPIYVAGQTPASASERSGDGIAGTALRSGLAPVGGGSGSGYSGSAPSMSSGGGSMPRAISAPSAPMAGAPAHK